MGKAKDIHVSYIGVDELTPYDKNAKKHTEEQLSAIVESIREFGFSQPIVAWHDESGSAVVVAGHGRLKAAKRLKMDSVPVVFVDDLSDEQRRALTLADNQTTMMTGWDATALDFELTDLADVFDMERFGFASNEEEAEEKYTSKIKGLIYEPCGVCPEVSELTDGAINEDVNTYTLLGGLGRKICTVVPVSLVQTQTQKNKGGMTAEYLDDGTAVKSMFSVMMRPDCVGISTMAGRYHHNVEWRYAVPKILEV